jgi:hypothetical protein
MMAISVRSASAENVMVNLTGGEETPPVTTAASGTGTIKVTESKSVSGTIRTARIFGSMAHMHVGAPGQSGPPIVALIKVAEDMWSVPPGFRFTDEQYASFKAGDVYVNIQSPWHKAGEIRAQLKP